MISSFSRLNRRHFIGSGVALGLSAFYAPGSFAEELARTAALTEGPFYPDKLPLDTDNDLLIVNDQITPGVGEVTHLTGKVCGIDGEPLRNALVEIWQCDNNGAYHHTRTGNAEKRDKNFQGFGRFLTGSDGAYYFRTIKPVAYPGRTPHIHVKIKQGGKELLVTQLFISGHAGNDRDGVLRGVRDAKLRDALMVEFKPIAASKIGELAANFPITVGKTPVEGGGGQPMGPPGRGPGGPGGPPPDGRGPEGGPPPRGPRPM